VAGTFSQSTVAEGQSAPNFAIYRTIDRTGHRTIHWAHFGAWSNHNSCGPRPQLDAGLYDTTGRI
jgi:hypothetical protein